MRHRFSFLIPLVTLTSLAQTAKPGTGTVTGHVYCTDTNAPARMTRVRLVPVDDAQSRNPSSSTDMTTGGIVQTAVDGSFMIPNVAPGRYYVVASAAGYLTPDPELANREKAGPPMPGDQPRPIIPQVEVLADQTAAIEIRLDRGAAVSGTVRFDDGSPAAGIHIGLLHLGEHEAKPSNSDDVGVQGSEMTNDLGRYRISGMPDGKYTVEALLSHLDLVPSAKEGAASSEVMRSVLIIYSGDATRKSAAAAFTLSPGEERNGEDITIPISKLHSISGVVTAARDGHPVNAGNFELVSPEDKEIVVDAEIASDGTFHVEAVPEGNYILRIRHAHDNSSNANKKAGQQYGDLEQPLHVESDIPNLVLSIGERKNN